MTGLATSKKSNLPLQTPLIALSGDQRCLLPANLSEDGGIPTKQVRFNDELSMHKLSCTECGNDRLLQHWTFAALRIYDRVADKVCFRCCLHQWLLTAPWLCVESRNIRENSLIRVCGLMVRFRLNRQTVPSRMGADVLSAPDVATAMKRG